MTGFILGYIDPGGSSYIVQIIIGAIVGFGFFFKSIWWRIKSFFTTPKKEDKTQNL